MRLSLGVTNANDITLLYELNQQNIPELGSLDSADHLKSLIEIAFSTIVLMHKNQIIGFCLLFREGSSYNSPNYSYFNTKYDKFIYVDRVVVSSDFIGKGGGRLMYQKVFEIAEKNNLTICCEVNEKPLNEISLAFHNKLGFYKTHEKAYAKKKVAFLEKPPCQLNK